MHQTTKTEKKLAKLKRKKNAERIAPAIIWQDPLLYAAKPH